MMQETRHQKLQMLTGLMDAFMDKHEEDIKQSLKEEGRVLFSDKLERTDMDVEFGMMILSTQEVDVTVKATQKEEGALGKSLWMDVRKREHGGVVLFNGNTEKNEVVRYSMNAFLSYIAYLPMNKLFNWMKEAEDIRKVSMRYQKVADAVARESLVNYYLEKRDFASLQQFIESEKEG